MLRTWLTALPFVLSVPLFAQEPPTELLARIPPEYGLGVFMHNLEGTWGRVRNSPWAAQVSKSALAARVLESPEFRQLRDFEAVLKKNLDLDWASLRDELLGDVVILAYRPGPAGQESEQGIVLARTKNAELLARVIERLNKAQIKGGEVLRVTERRHQDTVYFERVLAREQKQYYLLEGPLLALTTREEGMQALIQRKGQKSSDLMAPLQKAGADRAFLTLWVYPRVLDAEIEKQTKTPGPPGHHATQFLTLWKCFDGVFLSLHLDEVPTMRLSLVGRGDDMPEPMRTWFTESGPPSELWNRFPQVAILTIATQQSFEKWTGQLAFWILPAERQKIGNLVQASIGAITDLDVKRDILPNVGPDVGLCVFPSQQSQHVPQALVALRVANQPAEQPVDQAFFGLMTTFAQGALLDLNHRVPQPIRLKTGKQDQVVYRSFVQETLFPPGFQPSFGLKGGYLLVASSPEGIAQFSDAKGEAKSASEIPLARFSARELATVIRNHRAGLVAVFAKDKLNEQLDALLEVLDLFERVELRQRRDPGVLSWNLRIEPRK